MTDQEWDELGNFASGNDDRRAKAQILAVKEQVKTVNRLSESIFNHQKITGLKLERLSDAIEQFNAQSGKIAGKANWIAGIIAFSAVVQLIITIIKN